MGDLMLPAQNGSGQQEKLFWYHSQDQHSENPPGLVQHWLGLRSSAPRTVPCRDCLIPVASLTIDILVTIGPGKARTERNSSLTYDMVRLHQERPTKQNR